MGKIYALLVGINDYHPNVGRLYGCLNDVGAVREYLTSSFAPGSLEIETLEDSKATHEAIVHEFGDFLGRAGADDVALFHFSGHGARWASAKEFHSLFPDGKDEGLVCVDSRRRGIYDLADKELAVLLSRLSKNGAHVAVVLDSCHSGSATRSADDFTHLKARQTHERTDERDLATYLDGYYSKQKSGMPLEIPAGRYIALSACEKTQKAWEANDHRGVFTSTLLEVLEKTGTDVTYADLFLRARAAVRKRADNQDPQFETYGGFHAYEGFLGRKASRRPRRFSVSHFRDDMWEVNCGFLHGLSNDPDKRVELALYADSDHERRVGGATTTQVGPETSLVELTDVDADRSDRFEGEITSLPAEPLAIFLHGDSAGTELLESFEESPEDHFGVSFTDTAEGTRYSLSAEDGNFLLKLRETGKLIQGAEGYTEGAARYIFSVLKSVADWERAVLLRNDATRMNTDEVSFRLHEVLEGGDSHEFPTDEITLDIRKDEDGKWQPVPVTLKARNLSAQPLHFLLVHLSDDYGVQTGLYNEEIAPAGSEFTVTLMGRTVFYMSLKEHEGDEAIHRLKLIVSTEKIDDFLLAQKPLKIGHLFSGQLRSLELDPPREKHEHEWFTKDLTVKLARKLDRVGKQDATLAQNKITIKGHEELEAEISLSTAASATRGVGAGSDIHRVLERQGWEMLNFAGTRGEAENVLELTEIKNPEVLERAPLEMEIAHELAEGEIILPFSFDGDHILLTGNPSAGAEGRTRISISEVPEIPDHRRSPFKALKLYFFKKLLRRENVDQLCWVDYRDDGTVERRPDGVREKVSAAKNVLLLLHGIVGDTRRMAESLRNVTGRTGSALNERFDLVLTYDYENLNTPIAKISEGLKRQLSEADLHEGDDRRLTILAHSMGGLVSRWLIERVPGGNETVDHLVMCGTPNVGSPFGKIDEAVKLARSLTEIAINLSPLSELAPFGGALLYALNGTGELTGCLGEMNPSSRFIKDLNGSRDPGVRYTIVAGDTREYSAEKDGLMGKLVTKVGRSVAFDALYGNAGHDIAVSVDSILGVPDARSPAPVKQDIVGHHLNYFVNEISLRALASIEW